MVAVTPVSGGGGTGAAADPLGHAGLGKDVFLRLLVAQLQYQDPLQPMDNTQFVTQLATFQTLEELQAIRADLDRLVAAQQKAGTGAGPAPGGSPPPGGSGR